MPGGWGRRAIGKPDSKIEDDVLFKEIGGQLDASNFDYSQWQRTNKPEKKPLLHKSTSKPNVNAPLHDDIFRPGGSGFSGLLDRANRRAQSAGSSSCHSHRQKAGPSTPTNITAAQAKREAEAVKILQLRIKARQQTLDEYKLRQLELFQENLKLKKQIEEDEATSHAEVKNLLRKYERFRGGVTTLNSQFLKDLEAAKQELSQAKAKLDQETAKRQKEVQQVKQLLEEKKEELQVLKNFKDKDYPVKALQITELQKEISALSLANKAEEAELKEIVQSEIKKLHTDQEDKKMAMADTAMQKAVDSMHPSLREMATHNLVMKKEILFHKAQIEELEAETKLIEKEVENLVKDPKSNIRMMMFPEFYPDRPKCTPDMDVVLDIPTHEWLPI